MSNTAVAQNSSSSVLDAKSGRPKRHSKRGGESSSADSSPLYLQDPAPLRLDAWEEPDTTSFFVRGPSYLSDRLKIQSEKSIFRLLTTDLIYCPESPITTGICSHPTERIQRAMARERKTGVLELPEFVFAVNLVVPAKRGCHHSVFYFGCDDVAKLQDQNTPFGRLASQFFFGPSDEFRNETFKLIPRIVDGSYLVKNAVGSKPAILGKKIQQYFVQGGRFFEIIVDIRKDSVARKIVSLSIGYAKTMVVDMAFLLEGQQIDLLPEVLLGAVRMKKIEFKHRDGKRLIHK